MSTSNPAESVRRYFKFLEDLDETNLKSLKDEILAKRTNAKMDSELPERWQFAMKEMVRDLSDAEALDAFAREYQQNKDIVTPEDDPGHTAWQKLISSLTQYLEMMTDDARLHLRKESNRTKIPREEYKKNGGGELVEEIVRLTGLEKQ